jgi:hypothetical protein
MDLTKARNSSLTLIILIAKDACAVSAFLAKPLPAFWATLRAACAVLNCCNNGRT